MSKTTLLTSAQSAKFHSPPTLHHPWLERKIAPDFGVILRARRKDLAMTQVKLGEKLEVSAAVVGAFERGQRTYFPRPYLFWEMVKALKLTPTELLEAAYGQSDAAVRRAMRTPEGRAALKLLKR